MVKFLSVCLFSSRNCSTIEEKEGNITYPKIKSNLEKQETPSSQSTSPNSSRSQLDFDFSHIEIWFHEWRNWHPIPVYVFPLKSEH
ncbi:hypothetical protein L1887_18933 [Cichorium endivia]|nr:hypothetical protein L1887_18933 [Cichorium endivia]